MKMMMPEQAIDLSEEALGIVCEAAEQLKGSVVAAEDGLIESLRWSGALPLLLRDFEVSNVLDLDELWKCQTASDVLQLLDPVGFAVTSGCNEENHPVKHRVDRLVLLVGGFLWDYEHQLRQLVALQVVNHVVVCSSISERAHECYSHNKTNVIKANGTMPSSPAATGAPATPASIRRMDFDAFAQSFGGSGSGNSFQATSASVPLPLPLSLPQQQQIRPNEQLLSPRAAASHQSENQNPPKASRGQEEEGEDDWEWNDPEDSTDESETTQHSKQPAQVVSPKPTPIEPPKQMEQETPLTSAVHRNRNFYVSVVPFPLVYSPILSTKSKSDEPSLFVLSNPICARAFPLLLSHLKDHALAAGGGDGTPTDPNQETTQQKMPAASYSHVKEVVPEHIPTTSRREWKLVAYHLADMLMRFRLEAKERIYAVGSTSLKIGHTLLRILQEAQEEMDAQVIDEFQPASVILIDRTNDLATPCSFNDSLLDQILSLLPQAPTSVLDMDNQAAHTRSELHITELFPLHSCLPSPLPPESLSSAHKSSSFLDAVNWKGGVALCHSACARNLSEKSSEVFRSLVLRPAKMALRELDRKLQELELSFVKQGQIPRSKSGLRRTGSERPRGRDVVLRRLCAILDAGEPTQQEHTSLVQLAIIMLETLERMEGRQTSWDKCRDLAARQLQLSRQGGNEWILPELADTIQRQAASPSSDWEVHPVDLIALMVHAFSVSSGAPIEEYTMKMIHNVLSEMLLQNARTKPDAMGSLFPTLMKYLTPVLEKESKTQQPSGSAASQVHAVAEEDWEWNDLSPKHTAAPPQNDFESLQAKAICEEFSEVLLKPLTECAQLYSKMGSSGLPSTPKASENTDGVVSSDSGLVAQICSALMSSNSRAKSIPDFQKVVDASEQLTRAGIDLLKSGFSRFGFGAGGRSSSSLGSQHLGPSKAVLVFVVGGITIQEVQQVREALAENTRYQVLLGSTTITNSQIVAKKLFAGAQ